MTLPSLRRLLIPVLFVLIVPLHGQAATPRFKAVAFDYFVIFDPNSVVPAVEEVVPGFMVVLAKNFLYCLLEVRKINNHAVADFAINNDFDFICVSVESTALGMPGQEMRAVYVVDHTQLHKNNRALRIAQA